MLVCKRSAILLRYQFEIFLNVERKTLRLLSSGDGGRTTGRRWQFVHILPPMLLACWMVRAYDLAPDVLERKWPSI